MGQAQPEMTETHLAEQPRADQTAAADVAIIVVSMNSGKWLPACLSSVLRHAGDATLDVVVVDNESTDDTRSVVEANFPQVRVLQSPNRGFASGNNRGLESTSARYVLFLNPDTEIRSGTFSSLVSFLDEHTDIGLVGARQVTADDVLYPTVRRFPSATRALGEAFASERWPVTPAWAGERVLDLTLYDTRLDCDWTSGSFMLARREALVGAGCMDERFFLYAEEPDLCLRIKRAGWRVVHVPDMTILHHAGKDGVRPRMVAQEAFARRQYAEKHFSSAHRSLYLLAIGARHAIRAVDPRGDGAKIRRQSARRALSTLMGRSVPPFGDPPSTALKPPEPS